MSKKFTFVNANGEKLSAKIELPSNQAPAAYALFAHCFTCNKNLTAVRNISKALTQKGIAVMRFDFTGLGDSEGDFADTNFSSNIQDLVSAADALAKEYEAPQLLIGHSLGGAAVIYAGSEIPSIKAIATIGAPSSPDHVQNLFESSVDEIEKEEKALVNLGGRNFTIKKQFIDDLQNRKMSEVVEKLRLPLMIMHSPQDTTVGIKNAAEIYQYAMHPKSFISLNGADHLLTNKKDSQYAGNMISEWATQYIDLSKNDELRPEKQVSVRIGSEGYTTDIIAGKHALRADEPVSVGGNNFGPTPYDLLLASIGACTAMTLRMYADRKKWDLQEVVVHLSHSKEHAADCESCTTETGKIDQIERSIKLVGDLDEKQKARLLQIADKCPVHKTLHNEVKVLTSIIS